MLVGLIARRARPLAREPAARPALTSRASGSFRAASASPARRRSPRCAASSTRSSASRCWTAEPWLELVHDYPDKQRAARRLAGARLSRARSRRARASCSLGRRSTRLAALPLLAADLADRRTRCWAAIPSQQIASRKRTSWLTWTRSLVDAAPAQEAHREAVLAGADLREDAGVRRQQDAHEVQLLAAVEAVLEEAARRDLLGRLPSPRA